MKSTIETLEPTRVKLNVEAPYEEMKSEMDRAYKDIASKVSIPGFRKGHVPPRVIDRRFGRAAVIEQAVNEVLPRLYSQAVFENNLRPMVKPEIEVTTIPTVDGPYGGELVFTAEISIVPDFEIPELNEDVVIEVEPAEVTEEDVTKELDELRGRFASLKSVERKAKTGDFVTIDMTATLDGEKIDSVSEVSYEIGTNSMLAGQDTALRGTRAGDDVTFTSKLKGGDHKGESADVSLHVHSVKVRELPEADEDFVQMVSEFDTLDELLEDLRKQVATRKKSDQAVKSRDKLLQHIIDNTEILIPEVAIEQELVRRLGENAKPAEKKKARPDVEQSVREELVTETIAEKYNVQVSQQELIDYVLQMSQGYGIDPSTLMRDSTQVNMLVAQLGRSKALIAALGNVTVKDTNGEIVDLSDFLHQGNDDEHADTEDAEGSKEDSSEEN